MGINKLGIDCATRGYKVLIANLKRLKTTISIESMGVYHFNKSYTMLHIDTTMSIGELDNWLYNRNSGGIWESIGTFERKEN